MLTVSSGSTPALRAPCRKPTAFDAFQSSTRWTSTATNGSGLAQWEPIVLTWSYLPDGTPINGGAGEPSSASALQARLHDIYGNFSTWHALFKEIFQRWSELTGITYIYEPNDDGADFPSTPGERGVRGDIRIGGHLIDGNSGVLAYNYYPDWGDMVIDTADSFFDDTSNNSLGFRNVLAHEHGHGLGLSHSCPVNQTKLMEPYISRNFDGPQFDDILGAQQVYGDVTQAMTRLQQRRSLAHSPPERLSPKTCSALPERWTSSALKRAPTRPSLYM
jgi:Matrixin